MPSLGIRNGKIVYYQLIVGSQLVHTSLPDMKPRRLKETVQHQEPSGIEEKERNHSSYSHSGTRASRRLQGLSPSIKPEYEKKNKSFTPNEQQMENQNTKKKTEIINGEVGVKKPRFRKILTFKDSVTVEECARYDRRVKQPWTMLSSTRLATIHRELNTFKMTEMVVHQDSKQMTFLH